MERQLLRGGITRLAAMDEVGRGSPAGPAFVGVIVVDSATRPAPIGVRDSKLLSPAARESLVPAIERWAADRAVGVSTADEVDRFGIIAALGLAGRRALAQLALPPDLVLLDGNHNWLRVPADDGPDGSTEDGTEGSVPCPVVTAPVVTAPLVTAPVVMKVKADRFCASVAAASIIAKVARDAVMVGLAEEFPGYGWEENKGYATPDHLDALRRLGPSPHHRVTWRLPERV
jgi:ribonuclease HII